MRVLMVSDVYFPRVNGVSTSIESFRTALVREGVEVRLVVPRYGGEQDEKDVIRVPARVLPLDPEDRLMRWRKTRDTVREAAWDCDLIHIQTPFLAHYAGLNGAEFFGRPTLATYHTFFEEYLYHYAPFLPSEWLRRFARRFSRSQCNALDGVVVPSSAMRDRLAEYGVTVPMHVLPTGIPLARFQSGDRTRFRLDLGIHPDRPVALYVGRVAHEKNIGFLLAAVAQAKLEHPDLLFLVTGEGPALPALRKQSMALGLAENVRFLGYLDRQNTLPDCYAAADVFVFSSRTETQGLVLLEAMAMGLPVIALSAMGTVDILASGKGCLTPADDVAEFTIALCRVLADQALRTRLSAEAKLYAEEWSEGQMAARMALLYRSYAKSGARRIRSLAEA